MELLNQSSERYVFKVGEVYVVSLTSESYTLTKNYHEAKEYSDTGGRMFLRNLKNFIKNAESHNLGELKVIKITRTLKEVAEELPKDIVEVLANNDY